MHDIVCNLISGRFEMFRFHQNALLKLFGMMKFIFKLQLSFLNIWLSDLLIPLIFESFEMYVDFTRLE